MRLIDADALIKKLQTERDPMGGEYSINYREIISEMPTISPRPNWTPCAEGMPKKDGIYDVTLKSQFGRFFIEQNASFENGEWLTESDTGIVIAWMNPIQPYNPDRKEDAKADDVSQWPEWKQRAALSNYKFENADHIVDANKKVEESIRESHNPQECKNCTVDRDLHKSYLVCEKKHGGIDRDPSVCDGCKDFSRR